MRPNLMWSAAIWRWYNVDEDRFCGLDHEERSAPYHVPHVVHLDAIIIEWWTPSYLRINYPALW